MNTERLEMEGLLVGLKQEEAETGFRIEGNSVLLRRYVNVDLVGIDNLDGTAIMSYARGIVRDIEERGLIQVKIARLKKDLGRG